MNTWKVILATMLIFGTGVVTGGLLIRNSERIRPHALRNTSMIHPAQPGQPLSPSGIKIEFLRRMERDLNLSSEQRERIDKILSESQEHTRRLMEPVLPEVREELQKAKENFRAVLTPTQREVFDSMLKQQQRPHEQHRTQGHPPEASVPQPPTGAPARNP